MDIDVRWETVAANRLRCFDEMALPIPCRSMSIAFAQSFLNGTVRDQVTHWQGTHVLNVGTVYSRGTTGRRNE